jgi:hypothetical protein
MAVEPEEGGKLARGRIQPTLPVPAKKRMAVNDDAVPSSPLVFP